MPGSLRTQSQGPPAWLFTNNTTNASAPAPPKDTTSPTMAKNKSQKATKPATSLSKSTSAGQTQTPPSQLMDLVESFLSDQGFDNAHREFQKHRAKKGWKQQGAKKSKAEAKEHHSLVSVFQTWKTFASQGNTPALVKDNPMEKITKVSSSSSSEDSSSESDSDSDAAEDVAMNDAPAAAEESSSESSDSSSSDESDSSSEDSDEEEAKPVKSGTVATKAGANPLKRKAESDSESSSDSDSDSDTSDSEDERPQAKKVKTETTSESSSSSDSSDSSDSEDESSEDEDQSKPKVASASEDDSSSDSDSDSASDSDAEPEVDLKAAAEVPLPESDSSSESESESEDQKPLKGPNGAASDSSVTLDKTSPELPSIANPPLPPDPSTFKANNRGKNGANGSRAQNQPFSRIRKDVVVDPRLSSNAYVSHGYGEKAHQDLIITKGKGFTKEKNKKKRGSYKGGPLDIHNSRSIKFED
ncbi:SRP40, C-terminal domain-containing protein [Hypoxylon rubiginosum]|uniref:SRP40, C-terminal domain-containing protein n=1 Tax=Hypoxylon rubiginosum TaxID=110542 RepID=A0ACC0DG83_9PEZI|nr:SRP40, C-terminal domain-containing protein [Hypoxylon rubiginosum]